MNLETSDKSILHILKHNAVSQIFLGMIAVKNNLKNSFQDLLETLNDAGIIFVFFSQENEKTTKKLADIFLCEYDFNQCISLKASTINEGGEMNLLIKQQSKSNNLMMNGNHNNHQTNLNFNQEIEMNEINIQNNEHNLNCMLNQEGNKYLPTGVAEIKDFLNKSKLLLFIIF
jgi:hypothetical protein